MQWPASQIALSGLERTRSLREADKRYLWHPFTQMQSWCAPDHDPLVIVRGEGPWLYDSEGRAYLDGNSSIWTNIHGHNHPRINAAIEAQLKRIAHCSALGTTNERAIELAEKLVGLFPGEKLRRVFYTDDGSTAMECACKMAIQYWQLRNQPHRHRFLVFDGAYHGDTMGASSLGGIRSFHDRFAEFGFNVTRVADFKSIVQADHGELAAVAIEPLIQGAAQMRTWPKGMLHSISQWCEENGVLLILDEVMTGFGRTGTLFACEQEGVVPDVIALAKGLTGGYLPLAATLVTEEIFEAFLGDYAEQKTFYYGHSYCGNPIGCASALASLEIFETEDVLAQLQPRIAAMTRLLGELKAASPHVAEIRQCGFIAGIELAGTDGEPFAHERQTGARVCREARQFGLLTRPILDTVVLMPPLCTTEEQLSQAVEAIRQGIERVCGEN